MKIALFSHSSGLAGAERCLYELVEQLVSQFHCECFVVFPSEGPLVELIKGAQAKTFIAPLPWWTYVGIPSDAEASNNQTQNVLTAFSSLLEATAILKEFCPDIVISNSIVVPWGAISSALLQKPHVWMIHEYVGLDYIIQLPGDTTLGIKEIIDASSRIIVCSDSVKNALFDEVDKTSVYTVRPSIELPQLEERKLRTDGPIKIGVFTTISPDKGQIDAVLAVERLLSEGYSVSLFLTGYWNTAYVALLEKHIQENNLESSIKISGFVENPFGFMDEMDILISCSRFEPFGRFPVESLLLGKPVVYSNVGGPAENHEDGVTGLSYIPCNHVELAEKIKFLIDNPAEARAIANRGRTMATERFGGKRYAKQIFPILKAAITEKKKVLVPNRILVALSEKLVSLSEKIPHLTNEKAILVAERENLGNLLNLAKREMESHRLGIADLNKKNASMTKQIHSLASTIQFKNILLKDTMSENATKEIELRDEFIRMESEVVTLSERLVSLSEKIPYLTGENTALVAERENLEKLLYSAQNEAEAHRLEITHLNKKNETMTRQVHSLASTIQFKNILHKDAMSENTRKEIELRDELARQDSEIIALNNECDTLKTSLRELTDRLTFEQISTASLKEKLDEGTAVISSLSATNEMLFSRMNEISSALASAQASATLVAKRTDAITTAMRLKYFIESIWPSLKYRAPIHCVYLIKSSVYFDAGYYLANNSDVKNYGMCPATHYLLRGAFENRNPGPLFNSKKYTEINQDVKRAGMNPLLHYELHGKKEGRNIFSV